MNTEKEEKEQIFDVYHSKKGEAAARMMFPPFPVPLFRTTEGKTVKITERIPEGEKPTSKWDDLVFVGQVKISGWLGPS